MFRLRTLLQDELFRIIARNVLILMVAIAGIVVLWRAIGEEAGEIIRKQERLAENQAKLDSAVALRRQSQQLRDLEAPLRDLLLNEDNFLQFVTFLEAQAASTGNGQLQIVPAEGPAVPSQEVVGVNVIRFSISAQGTESSFRSFFERFSRAPYLVRFVSIEIEGTSGISAFSTMKAQGELFVRAIPPAQPASVPGP